MAKRIKGVSVFKGQQGISSYEIGAEMQREVNGEWEKLGIKVKNIILGKNTIEIVLSNKTSILFRDLPIVVDYKL